MFTYAIRNPVTENDSGPLHRALGAEIRRRRQAAGLGVSDLARLAGISKGFVSQIEHARSSPSLATLAAVALALGVPVAELLAGAAPGPERHRERDMPVVALPDGVEVTLLSTPADRFALVRLSLSPRASAGSRAHTHAGEECAVAVRGSCTFEYGDEAFAVTRGDVLRFDASVPHRYVAGARPCELLCVLTAPGVLPTSPSPAAPTGSPARTPARRRSDTPGPSPRR